MATVLVLSGCAGDSSRESVGTLAPSFEALYDQALERDDLSEWDRAALEKAKKRGSISQADYVEGMDMFDSCMQSAGVEFTRKTLLNGVIEFQPPPHGSLSDDEFIAQSAMQAQCYATTNAVTQELFRMQQANPGLLADFDLAIVNCLNEAGVVGDEFTKADLSEWIASDESKPQDLPFDVMDPAAQTCFYSLGYAIKVADE